MIVLFLLLFAIIFGVGPLFCAWLYQRKKVISHFQSYLLNALITFLIPFIWALFQDPVKVTNQIPIFGSASTVFLGNLVFGIPSSLIVQILFNFIMAKPEEKSNTESVGGY